VVSTKTSASSQGNVVLGTHALRTSLVTLSLGLHSPLLVLVGLLVKDVGTVNVVVLRASGSHVARLGSCQVTVGLLSVLLGLSQVTLSLPLGSLKVVPLSLLVVRESLVSIIRMG